MIPRNLRPPVVTPFLPGSRSSTVRRSAARSDPTPLSLSIARTGRSRNRFDMPAAALISLAPIAVNWSMRCPNSGLAASCATRSATNASARLSSSVRLLSSIGTSPAACAGATTGTGSGGVSVIVGRLSAPVLAMAVNSCGGKSGAAKMACRGRGCKSQSRGVTRRVDGAWQLVGKRAGRRNTKPVPSLPSYVIPGQARDDEEEGASLWL